MRITRLSAVLVALLAVVAVFLPPTRAGTSDPSFRTKCTYVRSAMDDPIVHPGVPGASHLHDFFGSRFTGTVIGPDTLSSAGTSCKNTGDHAAYWASALFRNGTQVVPTDIAAYYVNSTRRTDVVPYPAGLRMVAGDSTATSPQSRNIVAWVCDADPGRQLERNNLPTEPCPAGYELNLNVHFPSCWDGANLDSPDHRAHVAYPPCGGAHPVPLPELSMHVHYPTVGGGDVALASGGTFSAHADFVNGWDAGTLALLTQHCLNEGRRCR